MLKQEVNPHMKNQEVKWWKNTFLTYTNNNNNKKQVSIHENDSKHE